MKTSIMISGQISGNIKLRNALQSHNSEIYNKNSYGYEIIYPTKKEAKSSLWNAFKKMKADEPEITQGLGGLRYSKFGSLYYDASKAIILKK